jgi:hypothetical protein
VSETSRYAKLVMITSNRPARKRQIESKTIDEPPSRRIRRDVTTSELETIKAELEHERSLRALDAKRAQQLQQRLERQVEFAVEEAKEAKTLLEEIGDESENHIEQLREARKEALMELRECQLQLEEECTVAATEALEEDPKCARCARLKAELDAQEEENDIMREQLNIPKEELAASAAGVGSELLAVRTREREIAKHGELERIQGKDKDGSKARGKRKRCSIRNCSKKSRWQCKVCEAALCHGEGGCVSEHQSQVREHMQENE